MNDFTVKCPDCGSSKIWNTGLTIASDNSFLDAEMECQLCRLLFSVDYRPTGYSHEEG